MKALLAVAVLAAFAAGCTSPTLEPEGNVVRAVADAHHGEHFEPANITVGVGETVTFRIEAGSHTVDFEQVNGVSSPHQAGLAPGTEVEVSFLEAGTFHYYCQYHLPGMVGAVTVQ